MGARRPAKDLIDAVVASMRDNLEELKYSTLAPSRFVVYLHPAEHARLEGVLPEIEQQTIRALDEALAELNHGGMIRRLLDADVLLLSNGAGRAVHKLFGLGGGPKVQRADAWHVEFLPDPGDEIKEEGDILVVSDLALPAQPDLGVGERTKRHTTSHTAGRTSSTTSVFAKPSPPTEKPALARLRYHDNAGPHAFDMTRDSITVGRGGIAYPVDVRVDASADVSREHLRIRRDPASGSFYVIDLSSLGTTLDGVLLPKGFTDEGGPKKENGVETRLPPKATLGLAGVLTIEFENLRG